MYTIFKNYIKQIQMTRKNYMEVTGKKVKRKKVTMQRHVEKRESMVVMQLHLMSSSHEGFAGPAHGIATCALWTYTEPLAGQMHDVDAIILVFKRDENTIYIHALFRCRGLRGYTAGRGWGFLWVVARGGWSHTARFLWVVRVARGGWSIRVIV